jgi:hypothetical protein
VKWWLDTGFDEVYKYPIVYEGKYILSHDIVEAVKDSPFINIHGHYHRHTMDHPNVHGPHGSQLGAVGL